MTRNPAKVHERYPGLKNEVLLLDRQAKDAILDADIIVNCTPLGTAPDTNKTPDIPYEYIQPRQLCLDLVYNPSNTLFSRLCAAHGARTATGLQMLIRQAEDAWKFWMKQGV